MEPEYKAVIDQRRSFLSDNIVWNKKFREKLKQEKILPQEELDQLELDVNSANRTYKLLARLVQISQSGIFQNLCDILTASGQKQAAAILLQDRDNIVWSFDGGARVLCVDDFANLVTDVLLHRLQREEDGYIRAMLTDEVSQRFTRLHRYLQDVRKQHDVYRSQTLSLTGVDPSTLLQGHATTPDLQHRAYLVFDDGLEKMRREDAAAGQAILQAMDAAKAELEKGERRLRNSRAKLTKVQEMVASLEKLLEEKNNQSSIYLQRLIMEQDDTIGQLRNQIKISDHLVKFSKGHIMQLLSSIRNTCPRAAMLPLPSYADTSHHHGNRADVTAEEALQRHLKALIDLCEQQKERVIQTNIKMADLEKERTAVKTLLNARGLTSLPAALSKQLRAFREQKLELSETIRTLRQRSDILNRERDQMRQDLEDMTQRIETESFFGGDEEDQRPAKGRKSGRRSARGKRRRSVLKSEKEEKSDLQKAEKIDIKDLKNLTQSQVNFEKTPPPAPPPTLEVGEKVRVDMSQGRDRQTLISQYVNMQNK